MRWDNFKPEPEEDLEVKRAVVMLIEGEDPFADIQPIEGVAPRKCDRCHKTLSFISTDVVCPECREKERNAKNH